MNRFQSIAIIWLCFFATHSYAQQLQIDDNFTEQQLVEDYLVQGCVEISNIESQINGRVNDINSFGYFQKSGSNFPFNDGIMLTTGRAVSGGNGTNNSILNEGQSSWLTDSDLENALGISGTLNATSIEFDFISISNQISFNYILASEEYFGNFPCEYSDGFALLIKRADVSEPYTNIAVIPGTNIPVNTKTVHDKIVGFCEAENEEYFEGYSLGDTNYNGRTTVLTASASIEPNVKYHIKLVIADQTDKNYDSAVFIEGNSFSATVDLGEDVTSCAESYTLDADIGNVEAEYEWFRNGTEIPGETSTSLNIDTSGTYKVEVTLPFLAGFCTIEDSIEMNLSSTQTAEELNDYELCDDGNDGTETFDLSTKTEEITASVPESNYEISYHYSQENAENDVERINQAIQNTQNPQTIFVRIRDIINGCLAYSSFDLIVNQTPNISTEYDYYTCDDNTADGITSIDFEDLNQTLTNATEGLGVTYYSNLNDAQNNDNAIELPYTNSNSTETIYASVTNEVTGCSSVTTINLEVKNNPVINQDFLYIDACDQQHDGFATFDLTSIIGEVIPSTNGVTISFHLNSDDAKLDQNPIVNPSDYQNEAKEVQILYIRVEDDTTGCASVRSLEIHTNLLLSGTNIRDFALCDTGENDTFNLARIEEIIANELDDVSVNFFESENSRDSGVNELDKSVGYLPDELPKLLYITLNSPTCKEYAEIELLLDPVYNFGAVDSLNYCSSDQDNAGFIKLSQFDDSILNGQTEFTVAYYATKDDADATRNQLPDQYQTSSHSEIIYARISASDTPCFEVVDFELNLLGSPDITKPDDITVCDNDDDGIVTINLENLLPQITSDPETKEIGFFISLENAEENIEEIQNLAAYNTATQEIFIRVSDGDTSCYSIVNFNIFINTTPTIQNISDFEFCEFESDDKGEFIFIEKDEEIINGQEGKEALYFLTATDAENNTDPIDKSQTYVNTSNPQTIYVRLQNTTDSTCFATTSFSIVVGSSPEYNEPDDWFVCDDPSNDQTESFDLNSRINQIKAGINQNITVSLHTSFNDAQDGQSPINVSEQFENTTNPQTIFARIGNGNVCNEITSFELNVVQVPDANLPEPMVFCDMDADESVSFNLEDALVEILDVRQNNIVIGYYLSLADLETETNEISQPQNFQNTSNPQTVYIRLTNTISGCFNAIPLELIVSSPPEINPVDNFEICASGSGSFNLNFFNASFISETENIEITYYSNSDNAVQKVNPLPNNYSYSSTNDQLVARIENTISGCFAIEDFILNINPLPSITKPNDLISCDDDYDGFFDFNLNQQVPKIMENLRLEDYEIEFYNNLIDAFNNINSLPEIYSGSDQEMIYARVTDRSTGCYKTTDFKLVVNPLPYLDIGDQAICPEIENLMVSANTNNANDNYLWSTGATTPEIEINEIGTYSVTITTIFGCEVSETFNVVNSEPATILTTEVIDFSDPNNITITVGGIGNYAYQLDDGAPQDSNVFDHVTMGYHTITIIDLNGCSSVTKEVLVIDTPKFMTPNGDGYWDYWHIIGIETLPGTIVQIFDRYGKRLAQLEYDDKGWDGNHNGKPMPATDYWYVADVIQGGFEFQVKGHFALRR